MEHLEMRTFLLTTPLNWPHFASPKPTFPLSFIVIRTPLSWPVVPSPTGGHFKGVPLYNIFWRIKWVYLFLPPFSSICCTQYLAVAAAAGWCAGGSPCVMNVLPFKIAPTACWEALRTYKRIQIKISWPVKLQRGEVGIQKLPDYFGDISLTKATFRKYLKEKCWSKSNTQLTFKYFVKLWLIPKLLSEVSKVQTTLVKKIFRHNRVKTFTNLGFLVHQEGQHARVDLHGWGVAPNTAILNPQQRSKAHENLEQDTEEIHQYLCTWLSWYK